MAKEVKVIPTCDACGKPGADAFEVPEFEVLNSKGKPVVLDLHEGCYIEIYGPGINLADDKGVRPEKVAQQLAAPKTKKQQYPTREGERICLLCPETRGSDNGLLDHMQKEHGLPRSNTEIFGNKCPIDGLEYDRIAMHIAQSHKEFANVSQAFAWANENGDPHGVFKARVAAMKKVASAA
jgi:hypothetical protein